jgi:NDP-sugar pyrophosphorylase family protein
MERIVEQLQQAGVRRMVVATHYMPDKIVGHFGDGQDFGVKISYVTEDRPLGTAGALGLIDQQEETLLVINGDILTRVDFRAMLVFHQDNRADLTTAVRKYEMSVPYGVIENDGTFVRSLVEKPMVSLFVNAGIYLLEPAVHHYIPKDQRFDMTDLIQRLLDADRPVASFPIFEYWLDIGQHADYRQAQEDIEKWEGDT